MVLPKITFGLEAGMTESFYKILRIMKSYGNHDAQQLSIAIEREITGSKRDKGLFSFVSCVQLRPKGRKDIVSNSLDIKSILCKIFLLGNHASSCLVVNL